MTPTQRGLLRETLAALFGALAAYGIIDDLTLQAGVGIVGALLALVWAVKDHASSEAIFTALRKLLSIVGGAVVTFGLMAPEQIAAVSAAVLPTISLVWSFRVNSKQ